MSQNLKAQMDEWEQRKDSMPDQYTLAWWREQLHELRVGYRGTTHATNRCLADYADLLEKVASLENAVSELEQEIHSSNAELGRIRATVADMVSRMDRMSDWVKDNFPAKEKPDDQA